MKDQLIERLQAAAEKAGIEGAVVSLEYPENAEHGDFSANLALAHAKKLKANPRALAEKIVAEFDKVKPDFVASAEIAGAGFINFKLKDAFLAEQAIKPLAKPRVDASRKVMVEYTDPNPFKIFHIGHLMSNAIGESVSRLVEYSGAEVIRACYQGDKGIHVAKVLKGVEYIRECINRKGFCLITYGGREIKITESFFTEHNIKIWGMAYYVGSEYFETAENGKKEIELINKEIYEESNPTLMNLYKEGREISLNYFDTVYARLGTKFDKLFFESKIADKGVAVVHEFLKKDVFEKSEGAIVFKGEEFGLHTRVFINSQGLPTYEAKELGLNIEKFKLYPDLDESIIVTGNEINEYFKVLKKVLSVVAPAVADKTIHLSHGMLRFSSGKMSSRKGNIISAESLIDDVKKLVAEKMVGREFAADEADEVADMIAVAAIKYSILRQGIGGDVIFDSDKSISFEGDSGPYLQYSAVRAQSVLVKAGEKTSAVKALPTAVGLLERLITRFPDIAERARQEYAPQHIAGYLINLAGAFNAFYAGNIIVAAEEPLSPYRIALTRSFLQVMTDGLWLLGIKVPKRM